MKTKENIQASKPIKTMVGGRGGNETGVKSAYFLHGYRGVGKVCTVICTVFLMVGWGNIGVFGAEYGPFRVGVVRVYDGDTFTADVHVWPGQINRVNVRVDGIDAPELRTKNSCEKKLAVKARAAMVDMLKTGQVTLVRVRRGKYYAGRVLAGVLVGGVDVSSEMLRRGLAREYHGGKRLPWCSG